MAGPETRHLPFRRALIVEPVRNLQRIVTNYLYRLNVDQVLSCATPVEAIEMIRTNECDLVICGSDMGAGFVLASALRGSSDSPNREIPIVLLEKAPNEKTVENARVSGINTILVVPLSASALDGRLKALANDNLPFVMCETYVGPERRRANRPFTPPDRRVSSNPNPPEFHETSRDIFVRYIKERMPQEKAGSGAGRKVVATTIRKPVFRSNTTQKPASRGIKAKVGDLKAGMSLAEPCKTKVGLIIVGAYEPISDRMVLRMVDMVRAGEIEDSFVIAL